MQNLTRHIKEAIELNTSRMPRYAELSNGDSLPFSRKLIRLEKLTLLGTWWLDRIGDKYQLQGVSFMESEFIEMSLTPSFSETYPTTIDSTQALQPIEIKQFSKEIKELIRKRDYKKIVSICNDELEKLKLQPHLFCMLRHLIESLRRVAQMIPIHQQKCIQLNITSPEKYSILLLKVHLYSLGQAKDFDEKIAPIQNRGIPIIYQDVPHIGLWESV